MKEGLDCYTICIKIEEKLSPSQLLDKMIEGETNWGKCVGKTPVDRDPIQSFGKQHFMKIGYK